MAQIRVTRKHSMGKEAALHAAEEVAKRIHDKAQVNYVVKGDVVELERSGAKGRIVVTETSVTAEVKINLALRPMKGLIEKKMADYLDRYLS